MNTFLFFRLNFSKLFLLLFLLLFASDKIWAQAKFGDNRTIIQPGSLVELESTDKGFLNVRMTTTQMLTIPVTAASKGMMVYNTDSVCLCVYTGSVWKNICADTAYLNLKLNGKLNISDTGAMLSTYLRSVLGVKYTDTLLMLLPYARKSDLVDTAAALGSRINTKVDYTDTASMLIGYVLKSKLKADSIALATEINNRVKYTDTAWMLSPYLRSALGVKYGDTATMLSPYAKSATAMKYTDTASMLSPYLRSALGVKYGDTAAMLSPYAKNATAMKYTDTAWMLSPYLRSALGVKYGDTAAMLSPYAKSAT
ncbi:MAG: hypothetical protein V4561_13590, partial [Bacteroidota bacterium]